MATGFKIYIQVYIKNKQSLIIINCFLVDIIIAGA